MGISEHKKDYKQEHELYSVEEILSQQKYSNLSKQSVSSSINVYACLLLST